MARLAVVLCLSASLGIACKPAESPHARRAGMAMAIGGVVGILGSAVASSYSTDADEAMLAFEAVSAAGVILFAAHELSRPETVYKPETTAEKHHRWATILTEVSARHARNGNCARVRHFEPRVRRYDPEVHDFVFLRDPEIVRCLGPAPARQPASPVAPDEPALPAPPLVPIEAGPPPSADS